jgi:deoxyribonuclease V
MLEENRAGSNNTPIAIRGGGEAKHFFKTMIAAVDVHYTKDARATAGAVVFSDFADAAGYRTYTKDIPIVERYVPGQFYRRELPCIMAIIGAIEEEIDTVIIDGYVDLGRRPGLGLHLWKALGEKKRIIGVAKNYFQGSSPIKVFRRGSCRPLYITAAGTASLSAADLISQMHGKHRLPTLLKQADSLSRCGQANKMDVYGLQII